jgi:metal-responsive CopG/Arc/MetJ family transcriptional regulator
MMPRMTISLLEDTVKVIDAVAKKEAVSRTEVIRRTFTLLKIAHEEEERGNQLALVRDDQVIARVVGV